MTTIEVKTQRIIVDPPSGRIEVHGYGTQGPPGPTGPPGPAGPIGWPIAAPATVDGYITFTPSNPNVVGLRSATDVNTYFRFYAGPPNALILHANSGPLTSGRMGDIYFDADGIFLRSSDGAATIANFGKNTAAYIPYGINVQTNSSNGFNNAAGTAWFRPTDPSGNFHLKANSGAGMYRDADAHYWRSAAGANYMNITGGNLLSAALNITTSGYIASTGASIYSKSWFTFQDDQDSGLVFVGDGTWDMRANGVIISRNNTNGFNIIGGGGISMNDRTIYFRTYGDTSHRMYWQNSGSADPWCDGPVIIGYNGMAFYSAVAGVWRWGYRETNTYFWIRNRLLVGSAPDDAITTGATVRINGNLYATDKLENGRQGQAYWNDASVNVNPAAFCASLNFHPGGVAHQFRVAQGVQTVYTRVYDGVTPGSVTASAFPIESHMGSKHNVKSWPPRNLSAASETALGKLKKMRPVSYQRHDTLLDDIPDTERRIKALGRLNALKQQRGEERYRIAHDCATSSCDGTADSPCARVLNYHRGQLGFVAEEMELVFPEAVVLGKFEGGTEPGAIDFAVITTALVSAVQELTERLEELERAKA